jgi:hypothetical protein
VLPQSMPQARRQQEMDIRVEDENMGGGGGVQRGEGRQNRKEEIAAEYRDLRGMRPRATAAAPAAEEPPIVPYRQPVMRLPQALPAVAAPTNLAPIDYQYRSSAAAIGAGQQLPPPRAQAPPSLAPLAQPTRPLPMPAPRLPEPAVAQPQSRNLPPVGRVPIPPLGNAPPPARQW